MIKLISHSSLALISDTSSAEPTAQPAWIDKVAELVTLEQLQTAFGPLKGLNKEQTRTHLLACNMLENLLREKYNDEYRPFAQRTIVEQNCLINATPTLKAETPSKICTEKGRAIIKSYWKEALENLQNAREQTWQSFKDGEKTRQHFITLLLKEKVDLDFEQLFISILAADGIQEEFRGTAEVITHKVFANGSWK